MSRCHLLWVSDGMGKTQGACTHTYFPILPTGAGLCRAPEYPAVPPWQRALGATSASPAEAAGRIFPLRGPQGLRQELTEIIGEG